VRLLRTVVPRLEGLSLVAHKTLRREASGASVSRGIAAVTGLGSGSPKHRQTDSDTKIRRRLLPLPTPSSSLPAHARLHAPTHPRAHPRARKPPTEQGAYPDVGGAPAPDKQRQTANRG
jgi:hypothetical protein